MVLNRSKGKGDHVLKSAMRGLYDHRDASSLAAGKRADRGKMLVELIRSFDRPLRVLDVGGRPQFWEALGVDEQLIESVLILNVDVAEIDPELGGGRYRAVAGDARDMSSFEDSSFDLVVSNSVIEHVGDRRDQKRMADEVRRVAVGYFVQTPNYWFPIEPHFVFPLFQYLPIPVRAWLHTRFDLGWRKRAPTKEKALASVRSVQLLRKSTFQSMFPDGEMVTERFAGLAKSFVAIRGSAETAGNS